MKEAHEIDIRLSILDSGFFDSEWYSSEFPDVAMAGLDPLYHYITIGSKLGRRPSADFDDKILSYIFPQICQSQSELPVTSWLDAGAPRLPTNRILLGAKYLIESGRRDLGEKFAFLHLGEDASYPLKLLSASAAASSNDWPRWLAAVNSYLSQFKVEPLCLRPGQNLISRLSTAELPSTSGGPMVTVIMSAHNSEGTIEAAANSILRQTWGNLELLIVDDASTDGTWALTKAIAARDNRVRLRQNPRNLGPYVSKNIAIQSAKGAYFTGQDADDWAHPRRIENHLSHMLRSNGAIKAGAGMMLRVGPSGRFDNVIQSSSHHSPDGLRRRAFVSCLFEREAFDKALGSYDCVRFGADGEMLRRAGIVLGPQYADVDQLGMFCLDSPGNLTNHPKFGLKAADGANSIRRRYESAYKAWQDATDPRQMRLVLGAPNRPFLAPEAACVPQDDITAAIGDRPEF